MLMTTLELGKHDRRAGCVVVNGHEWPSNSAFVVASTPSRASFVPSV